MNNYRLFTDNKVLYEAMLDDIRAAKDFVYLETYIYGNDGIGRKFRDALIEKARQGVKIKVIIDDFGSEVNDIFFKDLASAGGEVKFYRKFIYSFRILSLNNNRNHRKLLVIDNRLAFLGSSNIKERHLSWQELNIRLEDEIASHFADVFLENFEIAETKSFRKKTHLLPIRSGLFEIIRDIPSLRFKRIRKRKIELIRQAKNQILIVTPYFLPDKNFRQALKQAARKRVAVKIILPKRSDIKVIDILRNRYLGTLYKHGVEFYFLRSKTLHAKFLVIDDSAFSLGSANINYRSLYTEFELNLFGWHRDIARELKRIFYEWLLDCDPFDYRKYQARPYLQRLSEKLIALVKENL